jgi:hypothetical protein
LALCFLFAAVSDTHAQEVSLSISPPLTELTIQPGKTFNQVFTIKNDGVPVVLEPKIIPFVPFDKDGHAELIDDQNSINFFSSWFFYDPSPISLKQSDSHDFYVKITPPETIKEGDYYFTFTVVTKNDNNIGSTNSQSQIRIGANILLSASKDGNPSKEVSIGKFGAPKILDSFSPLTYEVELSNPGKSLYKPTGTITISKPFGSDEVLSLAPLNVLSGGTRKINCIKNETIVPCKATEKFLIGIYKSKLSFTTDSISEENKTERTVTTIAFPYSITLGLLLLFIAYKAIRKLAPNL